MASPWPQGNSQRSNSTQRSILQCKYLPVLQHGNGKYTIYKWFSYWNPHFWWIILLPRLITGGIWISIYIYVDMGLFERVSLNPLINHHSTYSVAIIGDLPQFQTNPYIYIHMYIYIYTRSIYIYICYILWKIFIYRLIIYR